MLQRPEKTSLVLFVYEQYFIDLPFLLPSAPGLYPSSFGSALVQYNRLLAAVYN